MVTLEILKSVTNHWHQGMKKIQIENIFVFFIFVIFGDSVLAP